MFARPFCFRRCFVFALLALISVPLAFAGDDEDCEIYSDDGNKFYDITQDPRVIHDNTPRTYVPEASMWGRYRAVANTLTSLMGRKKFSQKLLTGAMRFIREQLDSEPIFYAGLTQHIDVLWFELLNFFEYCFEQALRSKQQRAEFFSFYDETLRIDAKKLQELLDEVLVEFQRLEDTLNSEGAARNIAEWMEVLKKNTKKPPIGFEFKGLASSARFAETLAGL